MREWFVVTVRTGKEKIALENLMNQQFEVFLPERRKTIRRARRQMNVVAPLFPGYLFASFDPGPANMRAVNGTRGVKRLITACGSPAALPIGFVEELLASLDDGGAVSYASRLHPGDRVEFACGPFARQIGELLSLDDRGRVTVLLQMLASQVPVSAQITDLLPA